MLFRSPIEARILAVADAYEAMTTDRPYKPAKTSEEARRELLRCSGTQFDERVVEAFLAALDADSSTHQSEALAEGDGS